MQFLAYVALVLASAAATVQSLLIDTPGLQLKQLLSNTMLKPEQLNRQFQASVDGWSAGSFHTKADTGLPSLVIAKVKAGGIFGGGGKDLLVGGYNPFGWSSIGDYRATNKAFVFNYDVATQELKICSKFGGGDCAVFDLENSGPVFGIEALKIPLSKASGIGVKQAISILGNDYARLDGSSGGSNIRERRAGTGGEGGSLFGDKTVAELSELELYCDGSKL